MKLYSLLLVLIFVSCVENDRNKAEKLFAEATKCYDANNLEAAKSLLDSVHTKFPRQVEFRRKADTLLWKITVVEIEKELPLIDAELKTLCIDAEKTAENFSFIKDEKYRTLGDYEHKAMNTAANTGRNYLKPITDEKGNFRFISTLVGHNINHRALRAECETLISETQSAAASDCNSYNDFGVNYETALFTVETAKDFILFIADKAYASDCNLKITLLGNKNFSYILRKKDAKIFADTFTFSVILKNIDFFQNKKNELENLLSLLSRKVGKSESRKVF
jgi:hypothetical protein